MGFLTPRTLFPGFGPSSHILQHICSTHLPCARYLLRQPLPPVSSRSSRQRLLSCATPGLSAPSSGSGAAPRGHSWTRASPLPLAPLASASAKQGDFPVLPPPSDPLRADAPELTIQLHLPGQRIQARVTACPWTDPAGGGCLPRAAPHVRRSWVFSPLLPSLYQKPFMQIKSPLRWLPLCCRGLVEGGEGKGWEGGGRGWSLVHYQLLRRAERRQD